PTRSAALLGSRWRFLRQFTPTTIPTTCAASTRDIPRTGTGSGTETPQPNENKRYRTRRKSPIIQKSPASDHRRGSQVQILPLRPAFLAAESVTGNDMGDETLGTLHRSAPAPTPLARRATQSAIYILFLKAGIACRPIKKLFARAVKPGYQGCISFAQPFGCVASRVSVFLVSMKLKLLAESLARPVSMS